MPRAELAMPWEQCLALVQDAFTCDDSSRFHARLRLQIRDKVHPAMIWHGRSTADPAHEVVHVASPVSPVKSSDLAGAARAADELPLGSLRIMNRLIHVHQALPLAHLEPDHLTASIRLVTAEALALSQEA